MDADAVGLRRREALAAGNGLVDAELELLEKNRIYTCFALELAEANQKCTAYGVFASQTERLFGVAKAAYARRVPEGQILI